MFVKLLLIFIGIPVLEMALLIKLGQTFGLLPTLAFVLLAGFAGAYFAKREGMRSWLNIQSELAQGRVPGEQVIDAFILFIAGVFLLMPGLISDLAGLFLLVPFTRKIFKQWLRKKFDGMRRGGGTSIHYFEKNQ